MNEETFNLSVRKFLKMVGVNSQREIEQAVQKAVANGAIAGTESFPASMTLEIPALKLKVDFDGEIKRSFMAYIYDHRIRSCVANQKMGNFFDGLLGSRKPDAHWRLGSQRFQSFERQRQMGSELVICNSVNFINDDGLYITQNRAAAFGGQQNVE